MRGFDRPGRATAHAVHAAFAAIGPERPVGFDVRPLDTKGYKKASFFGNTFYDATTPYRVLFSVTVLMTQFVDR